MFSGKAPHLTANFTKPFLFMRCSVVVREFGSVLKISFDPPGYTTTDTPFRSTFSAVLRPASTAPNQRQISRQPGTKNMGVAPNTRIGIPGNSASHAPPYAWMRDKIRMPCGCQPKTYFFRGSSLCVRTSLAGKYPCVRDQIGWHLSVSHGRPMFFSLPSKNEGR